MKYQAENAVSSFFYYMWNAWSKEECKAVFGDMYRHFWDKWSALADKSIFGGTVLCRVIGKQPEIARGTCRYTL